MAYSRRTKGCLYVEKGIIRTSNGLAKVEEFFPLRHFQVEIFDENVCHIWPHMCSCARTRCTLHVLLECVLTFSLFHHLNDTCQGTWSTNWSVRGGRAGCCCYVIITWPIHVPCPTNVYTMHCRHMPVKIRHTLSLPPAVVKHTCI